MRISIISISIDSERGNALTDGGPLNGKEEQARIDKSFVGKAK
jgi:hypothetical protein